MSRAIVFAFALALSSYAQTKPNFTGTWKLNVGKSDFGMMPPPSSRTDVIEQTDSAIKDTVSAVNQQGNMNYTLAIKTDGTESAVKLGARDAKVSAVWAGPALVESTKLDYDGNDVKIQSQWILSPDGNTWTQMAHITSPMGEMDQKQIFDKQSGGATSTATALAPAPATAPTATTAPTTASGAKPNFTGVWKLNVAKSDFGPLPGPESETDTIDHQDPNLKLAVIRAGAQGKQQYELNLTLNGTEQTNKLGDQEVKTTAQWEGATLVVVTKLTIQDNEVVFKSAYTIAPDGKTVNDAVHLSSAMGEADQKLVFEKQ
jgi:hypothetical protein